MLLMLILLFGCGDDFYDLQHQVESNKKSDNSGCIVDEYFYHEDSGFWLKSVSDPYRMENIRQAYQNLMEGKSKNTNIKLANANFSIEPSHYHVKFKPKNPEEVRILNSTNGVYINPFPFDTDLLPSEHLQTLEPLTIINSFDVKPDSYYYTHEEYECHILEKTVDAETVLMPILWASWPISVSLPDEIDYEILYEAFIPSDELVKSGTMNRTLMNTLEEEAVYLAT